MRSIGSFLLPWFDMYLFNFVMANPVNRTNDPKASLNEKPIQSPIMPPMEVISVTVSKIRYSSFTLTIGGEGKSIAKRKKFSYLTLLTVRVDL